MVFVVLARVVSSLCFGYYGCLAVAAFCHGLNGPLLMYGQVTFVSACVFACASAVASLTSGDR